MKVMQILVGIAGFCVGLGLASVLYLRTFTGHLQQLHEDNVKAKESLEYADEHITRKVEEQNMSALSKRLDAIEERLSAPSS